MTLEQYLEELERVSELLPPSSRFLLKALRLAIAQRDYRMKVITVEEEASKKKLNAEILAALKGEM